MSILSPKSSVSPRRQSRGKEPSKRHLWTSSKGDRYKAKKWSCFLCKKHVALSMTHFSIKDPSDVGVKNLMWDEDDEKQIFLKFATWIELDSETTFLGFTEYLPFISHTAYTRINFATNQWNLQKSKTMCTCLLGLEPREFSCFVGLKVWTAVWQEIF